VGSKYDSYWRLKLDEIQKLLDEAKEFGTSREIDVSDLTSLGERGSWYGSVEVSESGAKLSYGAHMNSLRSVLNTSDLLKGLKNETFRLTVSRRLKLHVKLVLPRVRSDMGVPMEKFSEKQIEEIIARHPELIERDLVLSGRQVTFQGKRVDLMFRDRIGATLIVELKKDVVRQKDVGQLTDYLGAIGPQEEGKIRIMLIGRSIPKLRRDGMDRIGIEYRQITHQDYVRFLEENDPELLEKLRTH